MRENWKREIMSFKLSVFWEREMFMENVEKFYVLFLMALLIKLMKIEIYPLIFFKF
jgi:hypothetical protein